MRAILLLSLLATALLLQGCCSIVIPPVTLTGSKTAIERQIVGEQEDLEKDIWLLASAKTAQNVQEGSTRDGETVVPPDVSLMYEALMILDAYADSLAGLKKDGVVGEGNKGEIVNLFGVSAITLSNELKAKYNPELENELDEGKPYRTLISTVSEVNRARSMMVDAYIGQQLRLGSNPATRDELMKMQADRFRTAAISNEYIQSDLGDWTRK